MKKCLVIGVLTVAALFTVSAADEGAKTDKPAAPSVPSTAPAPHSMPAMQKPEMIDAKVLKVYSAEDDGAKFKAYVVKWKDAEVVVIDPMGTSDKKEGDTIKVMISRMDMPGRGKMIRFMLGDNFGMKRPDAAGAPAAKPANPEGKTAVPVQPEAGK